MNNNTSTQATFRAIAQRIIDDPLAVHLKLSSQRDLEEMADVTKPYDNPSIYGCSHCSLYPEFCLQIDEKTDVKAELSIVSETVGNCFRNAEGDLCAHRKVSFKVNWPCYGSTDPNIAMDRIEFMQKVTILARTLSHVFSETHTVILETKAELEKREELKRQNETLRTAEMIIESTREKYLSGMRVGKERPVISDLIEKLNQDEIELDIFNKRYRINKIEGEKRVACVTRLA